MEAVDKIGPIAVGMIKKYNSIQFLFKKIKQLKESMLITQHLLYTKAEFISNHRVVLKI